MTPRQFLERAVAAALEAGAVAADGHHRQSRTRIALLDPDAGLRGWSVRSEEGAAVRAWSRRGGPARVAAAAGGDPEPLGAAAAGLAGASRRRPARPPAPAPTPPGEAEPAKRLPKLLDPEILRLSRPEAEQHLRRLAGVAGAARRAGPGGGVRAELRLSVVDSLLVDGEGGWHEARATLASFRLRFASAFGTSRIEVAARRLADLESGPLLPWLAAYPTPRRGLGRLRLEPSVDGAATLLLAPAVTLALMSLAARRAVAGGRILRWPGPGRLLDDPLRDWAPGSLPFDGAGAPPRPVLLGAPEAEETVPEEPPRPSLRRLSYRDEPAPLPGSLVLEGLAPAGPVAGETIEVLEAAVRHGGRMLARGRRRRAGQEEPVLVDMPAALEVLLGGQAGAGRPPGWLVADAFAAAPPLTIPGWRIA